MVRIIAENGPSLKALLNVPEELFGRLPPGLVLDEFSTRNVEPRDVKVLRTLLAVPNCHSRSQTSAFSKSTIQIPSLNMKVFKYKIGDDMKIPLAFMRTVNADEIHLQIDRLRAGSPMKPFGEKPANDRTKKLRVAFIDVRMRSLDLGRIFREVEVFFPKLECFELVYEKRFKNDGLSNYSHTYEEFTRAVDKIVTGFEKALAEADTTSYKVQPKIHVWYVYANDVLSPPEETDFKCGLLRTDLPPSEEVEPGNEHAYFVKETSANGINLRVDCEIIEGTESAYGSFSDDYTDSEDSVSTAAA